MATHNINIQLTTEQVIHLNEALQEHYDANTDALSDSGVFTNDQMFHFKKQCDALQTLMSSIKNIVSEVKHA